MLKPPMALFAFHSTIMLLGAAGIHVANHFWGLPSEPRVAVMIFATVALWNGMARAAGNKSRAPKNE